MALSRRQLFNWLNGIDALGWCTGRLVTDGCMVGTLHTLCVAYGLVLSGYGYCDAIGFNWFIALFLLFNGFNGAPESIVRW